ncbi:MULTISPECIES: DUF4097 family beta strand repeat-containing protein [Staphylococcus]|uniref:DUF4097 family beta strand repeat-containing protein n=1 Tax=Staphylococcus TaxID=1279 RepID=UPI000853472E|nr:MULTISPECIES: DUF4097 family beta strand repeat-containing protein [Staphylococcus]MBF2753339.1 DUF4097 family beta strand repeat protein [Staphylococcus saprophyticus]MBF2777862.1 DUF4097 family beta strand repeat protein [Staphylococcus saprophyticus]MBF2781563.1 DUF4097 family beta strand repeat protein [Staphylococcus saprophyticus]MDL1995065.1 DUF4097 domain-containing protein [Staphylococcus saprophyticus]MDW3852952.1 DUF4097 family beta strand repeat-containing protein [Staphylococcu
MKKLFLSGLSLFIVCFLLGCITWFGFEKQNNKINTIDKNITDKSIDSLNIKGISTKVNITKGAKFTVRYKGQNKVDINQEGNELSVHETNEKVDKYGLNFNPFRQIHAEINITMPSEKMDDLYVSNRVNEVNIQNLDIESANLSMPETGAARVFIKNSSIKKLIYRGIKSTVHFNSSEILNADIKTKNASIIGKQSLIKDSVLSAKQGNINLSDMDIDSAFKASTQHGDIKMSYNQAPDNTLLKLNPEKGKANVNNKTFANDRVGAGNHVLEFYTLNGDIYIN